MLFQPRGFKRKSLGSTVLLSIRHKIERIAAIHNCSKSYVVATLLAKQLGIKEQSDYEVDSRNQKRTPKSGRHSKVVRIESRKRSLTKAS